MQMRLSTWLPNIKPRPVFGDPPARHTINPISIPTGEIAMQAKIAIAHFFPTALSSGGSASA
jgi:hypothetical protein